MRRYLIRHAVLAAVVLAVASAGQAMAQDSPLVGFYSGRGTNFSGNVYPMGRFRGEFDPESATAVWSSRRGTLTNQTTRFDLVFPIFRNLYFYQQSVDITEGTGRFRNMTGQADIIGLINLRNGRYFGIIDGDLTTEREQTPPPPSDPPPAGGPPPGGPPS